eukprot:363235-Chlamydomonas_euryale.AAC.12
MAVVCALASGSLVSFIALNGCATRKSISHPVHDDGMPAFSGTELEAWLFEWNFLEGPAVAAHTN